MSGTDYGFDAAKLRAARSAASVSVTRIAWAAGVTERAVSRCLAGARVPRPELLLRLAAAVGVAPCDLCTVEKERLVHLRVWTGRSRSAMAQALGMTEETYRHLETTGERALSSSRYDGERGRWIAWQEWAAPFFGVDPGRLLACRRNTLKHWETVKAE